jgi:inorganic pyrophosphatase/exopolyphosphatase
MNSHISKNIFTLGTENHDSDTFCSNLIWNMVQNTYKTMFIGSTIDDIKHKKYTWENSSIQFLDNFKMDAFGEGHYIIINNYTIIARFGGREHAIIFNDNYTSFTSTRKDDFQIVNGNLHY